MCDTNNTQKHSWGTQQALKIRLDLPELHFRHAYPGYRLQIRDI